MVCVAVQDRKLLIRSSEEQSVPVRAVGVSVCY